MANKNIPAVPRDMPLHQQQFLQAVKDIIENHIPPDLPPSPPSNIHANPIPGGVNLTFTGGQGADKHLLLISPHATWNPGLPNTHIVDLGSSSLHSHMIGQPGVTRYYWITAVRGNRVSTPPTGPIKATTLPLATPAANPPFVPISQQTVKSFATNRATILRPKKGGQRDVL